MRTGSYERDGVVEAFTVEQLAVDEQRWTSTRSVDGRLVARLEVQVSPRPRWHLEAGGWVLRAGTVGSSVLWRRGEQEHEATAAGLTGASPAYDLALVALLALEVGQTRRVRLLEVVEPALAAVLVDRSWRRTSPDGYEVADLASGERRLLVLVDGLPAEGLTLTRP